MAEASELGVTVTEFVNILRDHQMLLGTIRYDLSDGDAFKLEAIIAFILADSCPHGVSLAIFSS